MWWAINSVFLCTRAHNPNLFNYISIGETWGSLCSEFLVQNGLYGKFSIEMDV